MKNLKIRKKLFIAFGISFVFFIATTITALSCLGVLSSNFTTFYQQPYTVATQAINMRANMQEAEKYLIKSCTSSDSQTANQYIEQCQAALERLKTGLDVIKTNSSGSSIQLVDEFIAKMDSSVATKEKIFEFSSKNQNSQAIETYNQEYEPMLMQARDLLSQIEEVSSQDAANFYNEGSSMQTLAFALLMTFAGVSLIIMIFLSFYIVHSITNPIEELEQAADKMSKGNLNAEIKYQSKDELGQLADSMRQMITVLRSYINNIADVLGKIANGNMTHTVTLDYAGDFVPIKTSMNQISRNLNDTLSQINQTAEQVVSGAEQVSDGAQTLSQGATEQASSIEELTTTVNSISDQIKRNAQNAQQSDQTVMQTVADIEHGNQQMQSLIEAMNHITETSSEIGKIIKTIDNIAFQTNILALNAAVEAARAGSAGKGFAVVADEVRNLAGKSAKAAKNTTELIENTIRAVDNGTQLADEAAQSFKSIVEKSQHVSQLVNEIAKASNEQANAVIQTTEGVNQISSVVQNNSATAQQSAAASEELNTQAQIMKDLLSKFVLKEDRMYSNNQKDNPKQTDWLTSD